MGRGRVARAALAVVASPVHSIVRRPSIKRGLAVGDIERSPRAASAPTSLMTVYRSPVATSVP